VSLRRLGALSLSVIQTTLLFVGVPVAVVGIIFALVFASGARRGNKRYRPGRPFEFRPVWFLSAPHQLAQATGSQALGARDARIALTKGSSGAEAGATAGTGVTGGASDSW
jgi:hypothetical protein